MTWFTRLFRGGCALCEPLESIMSQNIVEVARLKDEVERLGAALDVASAINAGRAAVEHDHLQAAQVASEFDRIKRELLAATRAASTDQAIGILLAWREWAKQGPLLQRENFTLRGQLRSVALQGMGTVKVLDTPLTDAAPRTGSNDN